LTDGHAGHLHAKLFISYTLVGGAYDGGGAPPVSQHGNVTCCNGR